MNMLKSKNFLFLIFTLVVLFVFPVVDVQAQNSDDSIKIIASQISSDGLYAITVWISNPNPKNLKLRAEYGEASFGLKSNTFTFDDKGRGTAAFSALRNDKTYQYRLYDTTEVLKRSETYFFTTSGGGGYGYSSYPATSYPDTSGGNTGTSGGTQPTVSSAPLPTTPPPTSTQPANTQTTSPTSTSGTTSSNNPSVAYNTLGVPSPAGTNTGTGPVATSTTSQPKDYSKGLVTCGKTGQSECTFRDLMDMVNRIIRFILIDLAVPIAAIMFFYAGFTMVTSGGSTEARGKAKSIFSSVVMGLIIVAGSWLVIRTLLLILGYDGAWIGL